MPNQQLLDYVAQQKKAGVAPEVIKKALLESGWEERDVDEAMKPIGAASPAVVSQPQAPAQPKIDVKPAASASPASPASPVSVSVFDAKSGPIFESKSQPKAASPATSPQLSTSPASRPLQEASIATVASASVRPAASPIALASSPKKKPLFTLVIMSIVILGLGVLGYVFWSENSELQERVTSLAADKALLIAEVDAAKKKVGEVEGQNVALTEANQDLERQISLFVGAPNATSSVVTVKGSLNGNDKISYSLITSKGVVLFIKNYKDPLAFTALTPLIGQIIEIAGTHVVGSKDITVTSVNGAAVTPIAPPPTPAPTP